MFECRSVKVVRFASKDTIEVKLTNAIEAQITKNSERAAKEGKVCSLSLSLSLSYHFLSLFPLLSSPLFNISYLLPYHLLLYHLLSSLLSHPFLSYTFLREVRVVVTSLKDTINRTTSQ